MKTAAAVTIFAICLSLPGSLGLQNGLARTPPMGWMSWERFRCNTDCNTYPEDCISERLFREMSDMLVVGGYRDVGYNYIIIDDCWLDHKRDQAGKLVPDPTRFPSGILDLSTYVHKLGLKFGIYEDYGNLTCGGYPGVLGHMQEDANTFKEWEVDYVKLDGCYSDPETMITGYPEFGRLLNATGRPMVYSCSWPAYISEEDPGYQAIKEHCNLWRNYDDIDDSWSSVLKIIDFYGEDKYGFGKMAGPGNWNDPDMLIIGNFGLSLDQARVQMGMWCLLAAPLIMSNDLRKMRPEFQEVLVNREAIKINQDPLGVQAKRILRQGQIDVYSRPILPSYQGKYSVGVGFLNRWSAGTPIRVSMALSTLGLNHPAGYAATDVFAGKSLGHLKPQDTLTIDVNPTGIVLVRFNILPGSKGKGETNALQGSFKEDKIQLEFPGLTGWRNEL